MSKRANEQMSKRLTTSFTFRIAQEEKDEFMEYCNQTDLSSSQCLRRAIKEYMRNHPIKEEN